MLVADGVDDRLVGAIVALLVLITLAPLGSRPRGVAPRPRQSPPPEREIAILA